MNIFSLRTGMGKIGLIMLVQMLMLVAEATSLWAQNPTATPTATSPTSSEFVVTDFYVPTAWMFYPWSTQARSSFTDQYTTNCVTAKCIKISWAQPAANEWIGLYWLHPLADGSGGWSGEGQPGCDFRGATSVKFWARGEKGGEVVNFAAAFYWNHFVPSPLISTTLTTHWVEYTIDLSSADLNNVVGAFGYYAFANQNPTDFTFYVDKITYQGIEPSQLKCLTDLTATPTTTATATRRPTATNSVDLEFVATSFYVPTAWMFNGLSESEIQANFRFDDEYSTNCLSTKCIKISWKQPTNGQQIGQYWLHPRAGGGGSWPGQGEPGCNLTGATSVKFWARGEQGGEIVNFVAAFYWGRDVPSPLEATTLTTEWTAFTIDLSSADLSNVVGAFGYYAFASQNPLGFVFYVDKITYQGIDPTQIACLTELTATPTATSSATPTPTATSTNTRILPTHTPTKISTLTPTLTATNLPTPTLQPSPVVSKTLILVYAALDSEFDEDSKSMWMRLVNNLEAGVHDGIDVRLLIDAYNDPEEKPRKDNSYTYDLKHDENSFCPSLDNPTCNNRYEEGKNWWHTDEDTADKENFYKFVKDALTTYKDAAQVILVLIGHGNGWAANAFDSQPSRFPQQPGGALWDFNFGDKEKKSKSLDTKALGLALSTATNETNRKIDLIYLDSCSMGMIEVAYELRNSANYLLSSPNISYSAYRYHLLLPEVQNGRKIEDIGKSWLRIQSNLQRNNNYLFTFSLIDLSKLEPLKQTLNRLADQLKTALVTDKLLIHEANLASARYQSTYDSLIIDENDSYVDINSFSQQLRERFPATSPIVNASAMVQNALESAVIEKDFKDGKTPDGSDRWEWKNYSGLSIYLPGVSDTAKQLLYTPDNLAWADDSTWDEFLKVYWALDLLAAQVQTTLPVCDSSERCKGLLADPLSPQNRLFLPLVQR